jgi:hypothetical protein
MSNVITELKELWKIIKYLTKVLLGLAFGWVLIVSWWALLG